MNRDEFEQCYAEKYLEGDYIVARDNRDGEGYTDHHIDLCWRVQQIKNACIGYAMIREINRLEW